MRASGRDLPAARARSAGFARAGGRAPSAFRDLGRLVAYARGRWAFARPGCCMLFSSQHARLFMAARV